VVQLYHVEVDEGDKRLKLPVFNYKLLRRPWNKRYNTLNGESWHTSNYPPPNHKKEKKEKKKEVVSIELIFTALSHWLTSKIHITIEKC
jgi:hypothetical protein